MEMLQKIHSWFTLADYAHASERATRQVVKRYTRGNVSTQNGWYLNEADLSDLSERGDEAAARLRKFVR
jgi:hypothetical protein